MKTCENRIQGENRFPICTKNVEAHSPILINIWVIHFGETANLWWFDRVLGRDGDIKVVLDSFPDSCVALDDDGNFRKTK